MGDGRALQQRNCDHLSDRVAAPGHCARCLALAADVAVGEVGRPHRTAEREVTGGDDDGVDATEGLVLMAQRHQEVGDVDGGGHGDDGRGDPEQERTRGATEHG